MEAVDLTGLGVGIATPVAIVLDFPLHVPVAVLSVHYLSAYVFAEDVVAMSNLPANIDAVLSRDRRPGCEVNRQ